jgi:hypothetical protein
MGFAQELCRALEECPRYLFGADLDRVTQWSCNFADLYIALAEECLANRVLKYKLLRKIHPFFHMYEDASEDTKVLTLFKDPQFPGFPLMDSRGPGGSPPEIPPAPFRRGTSLCEQLGGAIGRTSIGKPKCSRSRFGGCHIWVCQAYFPKWFLPNSSTGAGASSKRSRWNFQRGYPGGSPGTGDSQGLSTLFFEDHLNPRFYSGWTDETFMHHVITMSEGKDHRTVVPIVLSGRCS